METQKQFDSYNGREIRKHDKHMRLRLRLAKPPEATASKRQTPENTTGTLEAPKTGNKSIKEKLFYLFLAGWLSAFPLATTAMAKTGSTASTASPSVGQALNEEKKANELIKWADEEEKSLQAWESNLKAFIYNTPWNSRDYVYRASRLDDIEQSFYNITSNYVQFKKRPKILDTLSFLRDRAREIEHAFSSYESILKGRAYSKKGVKTLEKAYAKIFALLRKHDIRRRSIARMLFLFLQPEEIQRWEKGKLSTRGLLKTISFTSNITSAIKTLNGFLKIDGLQIKRVEELFGKDRASLIDYASYINLGTIEKISLASTLESLHWQLNPTSVLAFLKSLEGIQDVSVRVAMIKYVLPVVAASYVDPADVYRVSSTVANFAAQIDGQNAPHLAVEYIMYTSHMLKSVYPTTEELRRETLKEMPASLYTWQNVPTQMQRAWSFSSYGIAGQLISRKTTLSANAVLPPESVDNGTVFKSNTTIKAEMHEPLVSVDITKPYTYSYRWSSAYNIYALQPPPQYYPMGGIVFTSHADMGASYERDRSLEVRNGEIKRTESDMLSWQTHVKEDERTDANANINWTYSASSVTDTTSQVGSSTSLHEFTGEANAYEAFNRGTMSASFFYNENQSPIEGSYSTYASMNGAFPSINASTNYRREENEKHNLDGSVKTAEEEGKVEMVANAPFIWPDYFLFTGLQTDYSSTISQFPGAVTDAPLKGHREELGWNGKKAKISGGQSFIESDDKKQETGYVEGGNAKTWGVGLYSGNVNMDEYGVNEGQPPAQVEAGYIHNTANSQTVLRGGSKNGDANIYGKHANDTSHIEGQASKKGKKGSVAVLAQGNISSYITHGSVYAEYSNERDVESSAIQANGNVGEWIVGTSYAHLSNSANHARQSSFTAYGGNGTLTAMVGEANESSPNRDKTYTRYGALLDYRWGKAQGDTLGNEGLGAIYKRNQFYGLLLGGSLDLGKHWTITAHARHMFMPTHPTLLATEVQKREPVLLDIGAYSRSSTGTARGGGIWLYTGSADYSWFVFGSYAVDYTSLNTFTYFSQSGMNSSSALDELFKPLASLDTQRELIRNLELATGWQLYNYSQFGNWRGNRKRIKYWYSNSSDWMAARWLYSKDFKNNKGYAAILDWWHIYQEYDLVETRDLKLFRDKGHKEGVELKWGQYTLARPRPFYPIDFMGQNIFSLSAYYESHTYNPTYKGWARIEGFGKLLFAHQENYTTSGIWKAKNWRLGVKLKASIDMLGRLWRKTWHILFGRW